MDLYTASSLGLQGIIIDEIQRNPTALLKANNKGWTPIMYACNYCQKGVVEVCVSVIPSSVYSMNYKGQTPLMIAAQSGDLDIVKLVFKPEILECKDNRGWTALSYAVYYGHPEVVCFLIKCDADVNVRDYESKSVLTRAIEFGQERMIELLIVSGAEHELEIDTTGVRADELKTLRQNYFPLMILLNITSVSNLDDFLVIIGLDEYIQLFLENHIGLDDFLKLSENDLKKLGVCKFGPRRKLGLAIQKFIYLKDLKRQLQTN